MTRALATRTSWTSSLSIFSVSQLRWPTAAVTEETFLAPLEFADEFLVGID